MLAFFLSFLLARSLIYLAKLICYLQLDANFNDVIIINFSNRRLRRRRRRSAGQQNFSLLRRHRRI